MAEEKKICGWFCAVIVSTPTVAAGDADAV
jgi:hypothetical protein